MSEYEPICEAVRRLGLRYINIAAHGVKEHLGRYVDDGVALILFDKPSGGETITALWDLDDQRVMTSETLPFGLGMLWDWDWRAEAVEAAFGRLAPSTRNELQHGSRCEGGV
jgi:hypothetical protein